MNLILHILHILHILTVKMEQWIEEDCELSLNIDIEPRFLAKGLKDHLFNYTKKVYEGRYFKDIFVLKVNRMIDYESQISTTIDATTRFVVKCETVCIVPKMNEEIKIVITNSDKMSISNVEKYTWNGKEYDTRIMFIVNSQERNKKGSTITVVPLQYRVNKGKEQAVIVCEMV